MDETGKQLLRLMFKEGETVCVSHNKYGYHSIPLEMAMSDSVTLIPTVKSVEDRNAIRAQRGLPVLSWEECFEYVHSKELKLVALNPIVGYRNDINCTSFRNFLVEMDTGPLKEQKDYIIRLGMPYSACVFSGNKSLHFLISLDTDLPNEKVYRFLSEWILAVVTMADPNTKNPSRSIRIPGAKRDDKKQILVDMPGKVSLKALGDWLSNFPNCRPKEKEKRQISGKFDFSRVRPWARNLLLNGLDPTKSRNKQWFSIACEFAIAGYSEDDTIEILSGFFVEDRDFKEREWSTAIHSGFKYAYETKNR